MNNDYKLTLQEIEELSRAYLDCRLSRLQEKELELVLTSLPPDEASSPVIDEARETMAVASMIEASGYSMPKQQPLPNKKRAGIRVARIALRWSGIAAAIVLIAGTVLFFRNRDNDPDSLLARESVYVIVDGEVITGERAQRIAAESIAASLAESAAEIREITEMEKNNEEFKESIINEINNYL
ncbi:MAG: hypothetical protein K2M04_02555 [Muribaculaceae bacterium]|nr:hypothetical protein [Muribaculaceae bacterium]